MDKHAITTRHSYTTAYEISGVMRCCILSLRRYVANHKTVENGTEVLCEFEEDNRDSGFVLRGNIWKVRLFDAEIKKRVHQ